MKSYIQVYTGNGKGKTTAVLGLTLRALGAGKSVFIGQFLKTGDYSEIRMLSKMQELMQEGQILKVKQFGKPRRIGQAIRPEDTFAAEKGWSTLKEAVNTGLYDLVVMEELNVALYMNLLPLDEVLSFIKSKPEEVELVVSGRYAPKALIDIADLVSEIREIKHYYKAGVQARVGIEK